MGRQEKRSRPVDPVDSMSAHAHGVEEMRTRDIDGSRETQAKCLPPGFGRVLDRLKPNDHLALVYESLEEWRNAAIPFVAGGLARGERCLYLLGTLTAEKIRGHLEKDGVDCRGAESRGKLIFLRSGEICRAGSSLHSTQLVDSIAAAVDQARTEGYHGIRIATGARALPWSNDADTVLEYEARLNRDLFPKYPCVALCEYDRWESPPDVIKSAIVTHPLIVRSGQIHKNFYYIRPEELLREKRDEYEVQDMLNSIEEEGETQKRVRFLADVLDRSLQPFSAFYPDGRIMFCNPAFSRLTGYSEEELRAASSIGDLFPTLETRLSEGKRKQMEDMRGAQIFENELIRKDGFRIPTEVFLHEMRDGEISLQYYYAFVRDVTERKAAEERIREERMNSVELAGRSRD